MASIWKPRGSKNFYVSYYIGTKQVRRSLKTPDRETALEFQAEIQLRLARKDLGLPCDWEVGDFFRKYLAYAEPRKTLRSFQRDRTAIKLFGQFLASQGVSILSQITAKSLDDYMTWRRSYAAPATVNRDINTLLAALNVAVKWGYLRQAPKVSKFRVPEIAYRFLSFEEVRRLLEGAREHPLYPLIASAYYAGLRAGELMNLTWEDVHLDPGWIQVRNKPAWTTKSYKNRSVPLSRKLGRILENTPRISPLCFPRNERGEKHYQVELDRSFKRLTTSLGLSCRLKDLRETFGSHLAAKGVSLYKISRWLGHASLQVTERHYAHLQKSDGDIEL